MGFNSAFKGLKCNNLK